jgi:hypothetical protein
MLRNFPGFHNGLDAVSCYAMPRECSILLKRLINYVSLDAEVRINQSYNVIIDACEGKNANSSLLKLPERDPKFKKVRNMYLLQNVVEKTKPTRKQIARVKQQLEIEYWLSQALESGCFSLECSG